MPDHCHLSGKFRGAAHEVCNLKYKVSKFFPFVFHNLSGYYSYLFIKTLGNSEGDISCIPNNEENYISFTKQVTVDKFVNKEGKEVNVKRELRFIDSLRFMASSLDKLSSNLKIDQFVNLMKYYSGNQLSLFWQIIIIIINWTIFKVPYAWSWPESRAPDRNQDEIGKLNDSPNKCL